MLFSCTTSLSTQMVYPCGVGNLPGVRRELVEGIGSLPGWRKGVRQKKTEACWKIVGGSRKVCRGLGRS
ncbi:hypothetical protein BHM03_00024243 [Ensete ventricosum]|nr:hypothetical protein BHM03_00024243 [Ensete ventricosum]